MRCILKKITFGHAVSTQLPHLIYRDCVDLDSRRGNLSHLFQVKIIAFQVKPTLFQDKTSIPAFPSFPPHLFLSFPFLLLTCTTLSLNLLPGNPFFPFIGGETVKPRSA
jgi:hypothetical protein